MLEQFSSQVSILLEKVELYQQQVLIERQMWGLFKSLIQHVQYLVLFLRCCCVRDSISILSISKMEKLLSFCSGQLVVD